MSMAPSGSTLPALQVIPGQIVTLTDNVNPIRHTGCGVTSENNNLLVPISLFFAITFL
ncbi:hypothetical protein [Xenorhabdus hominickii]|uniref:hypothetical protein n=1 Tax=Xenorhabdus hominickii TaxID=351679 RepID=UPI00147280E3|nr:hypothetical protein [Xenorhabdus hominickii]